MATKTTRFSWKRKISGNISKERLSTFTNDNDEDEEPFVDDWRTLSNKRTKLGLLEDKITKSYRLKNEGVSLAQLERYISPHSYQ